MNVAWVTGLFEGEGCIYKDPRCNSIRLTLNSTDKDILDRFFDMVNCGYVRIKKHPPHRQHYKPAWEWTVWKKADVKALLELMLPLLGERRGFAALNAIDVIDGVC
jgi:hypothetical protein